MIKLLKRKKNGIEELKELPKRKVGENNDAIVKNKNSSLVHLDRRKYKAEFLQREEVIIIKNRVRVHEVILCPFPINQDENLFHL